MKTLLLSNLKLAFKNLFKNRILSTINILGLSIGIMAAIFIFQHIRFELSYDKYLRNADQVYRLVFSRYYSTGLDQSVGNNYTVGQLAFENIPEITNYFRCKKIPLFIEADNEIYKEEQAFFADSSFFDILSYPLVAGRRGDLLREPNVAVITESTAKKYFGEENPVGKTIYSVNPGQSPLLVQGVVKDVPPNSHLKFDIVVSLQTLLNPDYCYGCNNTNTYFLLRPESDPKAVSAKITDLALNYLKSRNQPPDFPIEYNLQKMTDIHLHSNYRFEHEVNGNIKYQWALAIIALFIMISAWLNFSNIYFSLLKRRLPAISIKRISGASWWSITLGFIVETIFTALVSLALALALLYFLFPILKSYLHLEYSRTYLESPSAVFLAFLGITGISIVAGLLVTMRLRKTSPSQIIKNKGFTPKQTRSGSFILLAQFGIAIFLIASTIVAMKQIYFMQNEALTMKIGQTLVVKRPFDSKFNSAQMAFQKSLEAYPQVEDITFSTVIPGEKNGWVKGGIAVKGSDRSSDQIYQSNVAPGFFDFFGIELLAGRRFYEHENNWNGGKRHLILNKEAAVALGNTEGGESVLGKVVYDADNGDELGEVVGVVDGYFQNSLDQEVPPIIFNVDQKGYFIFVKLGKGNAVDIISDIRSEFQKYFSGSYFDYFFLDDFFNAQYKSHVQFNKCFILFSLMAIIISSLSLLGVIILASSARIKEIGIRKVNGARVWEVLTMLNKEFVGWIIAAFVIATPLAWYTMHQWLENFAYKTELRWWIFALAGLVALAIALITVSWQSWKAATRNPVEALRYE